MPANQSDPDRSSSGTLECTSRFKESLDCQLQHCLYRAPRTPFHREFFRYTSGRWVYNEQKRLREKERVFDVSALQRLAAESVSRNVDEVLYMSKLSEGAANRAFLIEFRDGFKRFGRMLVPMDRMRREICNLEKQITAVHLDSLQKYSQISKHLVMQADSKLLRLIIRHPDLRPSNIFVSADFEIASLNDWQSSIVLPLYLQSGIPTDLDNSRDSASTSPPQATTD
ncbi:hypothetical protein MBLNU13_g02232t1 [Cladosporium sp. NU13]